MRIDMSLYGPRDRVFAWVRNGTCGINGESETFRAVLFPTPDQARQIIAALLPYASPSTSGELTPADGWDDPSAEVMNGEADADAADRLDRTRPE